MNSFDSSVNSHYGYGGLMDRILKGLNMAGKDPSSLNAEDLAPIDAFHIRGREATIEVSEKVNLSARDRVLDVGCGLGGTARHLAQEYGCHVLGIDLTDEYIEVGNELTAMVGLGDQVELVQGSALDLPFDDGSFDVVWTEHVQMNIEDKNRFYGEIARVLKGGGRLAFHDIFRGRGQAPAYPAPWAETESLSHLAAPDEARAAMVASGLVIDTWLGKVPESITFFENVSARIAADGVPPVGIHQLMGDTARDKIQNLLVNLNEDRVTVSLGIATKA